MEGLIKKIVKTRKNSCDNHGRINSVFQIDIQDMNFLFTSISNIESLTTSTNTSSLYSWSATNQTTGRITAQSMANTSQENANPSQENANQNQIELNNANNHNENPTNVLQDNETLNSNEENNSGKRKRKSRKQ